MFKDRYKIVVVEECTYSYKPKWIWARSVDEATEIAKEMREQSGLGKPICDSVDEVYVHCEGRKYDNAD